MGYAPSYQRASTRVPCYHVPAGKPPTALPFPASAKSKRGLAHHPAAILLPPCAVLLFTQFEVNLHQLSLPVLQPSPRPAVIQCRHKDAQVVRKHDRVDAVVCHAAEPTPKPFLKTPKGPKSSSDPCHIAAVFREGCCQLCSDEGLWHRPQQREDEKSCKHQQRAACCHSILQSMTVQEQEGLKYRCQLNQLQVRVCAVVMVT